MTLLSSKKSFFHFFPTPEYLLLSTTGIAITDSDIKVVQFRKDFFSNCLKLSNYGKVPIPAGAIDAGLITNPGNLSASLKDLASAYDLHYVHGTLPEEKAYLFTAFIDAVPSEGLKDAVAFIIEENVPVTLSDSVFDFEIAKVTEDGARIKVAVSVLPKKVVDSYISVFESAGLSPVSFDIESQSIARAIVPQGDKQSTLIINLNLEKSGFYVVENEVVQFSTALPYGAEGDRYRNLNDLKMEMRKIFGFWNARADKQGFPEGNVNKVLLCGEGLAKEDFVKELMAECPVEYGLGDPWVNTSCQENPLQSEGSEYISAIGLALPRRN